MKKVNKSFSPASPDELATYYRDYPLDSWEDFRNGDPANSPAVKQALIDDQSGLCAYCENDLRLGHSIGLKGLDDFRVEHFIPKSPHNPPPNHGLAWHNMLGVCTGGNQRNVVDDRYTEGDHCCDVPKGSVDLSQIILNPLDIPAFPILFRYTDKGNDQVEIHVNKTTCPQSLQKKAEASIEELRLNANRLKRFRFEVIDEISNEFEHLKDIGLRDEHAFELLAERAFSGRNQCPQFFTCIRWFLADEAEDHLQTINYNG